MSPADHARQSASRSDTPSSARPSPSHAAGAGLSGTILALQAQAGNRAVTALLQRDAVTSPGATPPPPASGGGPGAGSATGAAAPAPTTVAAPPSEGKPIERLGIVDNDTAGGGGLNLRAAPDGAPLSRLAHNDHLMVKTDVGGDWVYVIVTDGASKGTAGYASRKYVNTDLPPSPGNPDPGAILYRVKPGDRAHEVVRRHYGADAIVAGQDQRFFTNVLKYVNEDAGRGRYLVTRTKTRSQGGAMTGSVSLPFEDIELVAGGKIWIPSLPFAQALKGTVSAGSFARDVWEKAKDIGSKLVAVPAFIAGLVVGALESVKDLIVGVFELAWGLLKTAGGMLVDMAKGIWGLITDPTKRQVLLDSIDTSLQEMLYSGSILHRAYNWGRIVGYATMEVVTFVLLAGAGAALKAGKFGARLAKVFEVLKQTEAIQKTIKAAEALRKTEAAVKLAEAVEKTAVVTGKIAKKFEPVTNAVKKVTGAAGKVAGAPGEAIIGTSRVLAKQLRKVAAKYGWSESRFAEVLGIVEKRGATAYLRRSSKWAPARLSEGALPKPLPIKANTLDELDLLLGNGQFTKKDLGLVAHFEPTPHWGRPPDIAEPRWMAMQPELEARYQKRLASFQKNEADMAKLTVPSGARDSTYFEIKGGDKVKGGVVYQVDIDDAGKVARHPLTGDIDVFEFRTKGGKLSGPEYEMLDELFLEAGVSEHGGHMAWKGRGDYNEDAFFGILEGHLKDPVVEIGPGGKVRELTADQVPGVADVLASPEYKAWKARKTAGSPKPTPGGGGAAPGGGQPPAAAAGGAKQAGASPGKTAAAKTVAGAEKAGNSISVFHGTGEQGLKGVGGLGPGKIDVAHAGGAHQDLGRGFYLATDRTVAEKYAASRGKGGTQHVMQWDIPVDKLGVVVDIRPGGNFATQWEAYLERPFAGGRVPGQPTNRLGIMHQADRRGVMFDEFLDTIGMTKADVIIAPVGVPPFTGIGSGTQVSVRSQKVADVLNAIMTGGR